MRKPSQRLPPHRRLRNRFGMAQRYPLPYAFARNQQILLEQDGDTLTLWLHAATPAGGISETMRKFDTHQIELLSAEALQQRISAAYAQGESSAASVVSEVQSDADLSRMMQELPAVEDLLESAGDAPIIRMLNALLTQAARDGASDIHIEPFERHSSVRFRVDGTLREVVQPNRALHAALISRLKIMAQLDISERRLPQDGRISLRIGTRAMDVRVSTLPSAHGERAVLRLLDKSQGALNLESVGMQGEVLQRMEELIAQPHGIILVTGPTGSGKTTTLYTGLLTLNAVTRKVVTVEDPIEYQLRGINQIQIKPQIGLSFAALLRSILRQDPDVIMIGEIRDLETAQIAIQAALTGHLVLSTLHTNSAAAAITRLRDMGVEDYLLTAVLRGVMGQRLVRRLCDSCKVEAPAAPELVARFGLERRTDRRPITLFHPVGCAACRDTGYRGRQAIAEFLAPDAEIERLIFARTDHSAIERAAVAAGMVTMFDAGIDAALAGTTTIEEVARSIRSEN